MAQISSDLKTELEASPDATFKLIVRTVGDATLHLPWLNAQGITVTQQYRLTPGVAVTSSGRQALQLLEQPWVVSVELDQPVSAF